MQTEEVFERYVISRQACEERTALLDRIKERVDRAEIKIIDVQRRHDHLIVVCRKRTWR
ncbi:hypothetical protein [Sulfoacidibacillus thermotolerans]|uniref:hypothetical protein n=1 Tax=Sulfoacidibacillus thermotolerans TaxID=1765684 RepID=UPI0015E8022E|nr:hypothetical protein [Sulfoacidibacillus thermotolerans]